MIGQILSGQDPRLMQAQQERPQMQMPQIPQMSMIQQPAQLDPYGQQMSGIKAALMGRFLNGSI